MKTWTEQHIKDLQQSGKIRGYVNDSVKEFVTSKGKSYQVRMPKSKALDWLNINLQQWCDERSLTLEREFRFYKQRKWRSDFAIPAIMVLIEFEGSIFNPHGDHRSIKGISRDIEKYSRAAILGWIVIRYTTLNYTYVIKDLNEIYANRRNMESNSTR